MAKKISRPKHTPPSRGVKEQTEGKRGKKQFDNTNRGVLFQNDKEGNEARPDLTGRCNIKVPDDLEAGDVFELRIAAWQKESQSGNEFLSLNFQIPNTKGKGGKGKKEDDD
jgi:hypothetical protein